MLGDCGANAARRAARPPARAGALRAGPAPGCSPASRAHPGRRAGQPHPRHRGRAGPAGAGPARPPGGVTGAPTAARTGGSERAWPARRCSSRRSPWSAGHAGAGRTLVLTNTVPGCVGGHLHRREHRAQHRLRGGRRAARSRVWSCRCSPGGIAAGDAGGVRRTASALLGWALVVLVPLALVVAAAGRPARAAGAPRGRRVPRLCRAGRPGARRLRAAGRASTGSPWCSPACCRRTAGSPARPSRRCCPAWSWPRATCSSPRTGWRRVGRGAPAGAARSSPSPGGRRSAWRRSRSRWCLRCGGCVSGCGPRCASRPARPPRAGGSPWPGCSRWPASSSRPLSRCGWPSDGTPPGTQLVHAAALTVFLLPLGALAVPLATAVAPALAGAAGTGDEPGYRRALDPGGRRGGGGLGRRGPVVLAAAAGPLAGVFFATPATAGSAAAMRDAVLGFAPGLPGYALLALLTRALYARGPVVGARPCCGNGRLAAGGRGRPGARPGAAGRRPRDGPGRRAQRRRHRRGAGAGRGHRPHRRPGGAGRASRGPASRGRGLPRWPGPTVALAVLPAAGAGGVPRAGVPAHRRPRAGGRRGGRWQSRRPFLAATAPRDRWTDGGPGACAHRRPIVAEPLAGRPGRAGARHQHRRHRPGTCAACSPRWPRPARRLVRLRAAGHRRAVRLLGRRRVRAGGPAAGLAQAL